MRRTIIVMSYFNRARQLAKTLETIRKTKHTNYEIVLVNDGSDHHIHADNVHEVYIDKEKKNWYSPVIPQNMGVQKAIDLGAEIIILQNAECFHRGDILMYANDNLRQENYFSFACFSLDEASTFDKDLDEKLPQLIRENNKDATSDGNLAWYNHGQFRGVCYDFCSAITVENIIKLNGYNENFSEGVSYSDDELVLRIRRLGLNIVIPAPEENPFCVHQWHYSGRSQYDATHLVHRNRDLYHALGSNGSKDFRAPHTHTKNFDEA